MSGGQQQPAAPDFCSICLDPLEGAPRLERGNSCDASKPWGRMRCCSAAYHAACLGQWAATKQLAPCPNCQRAIIHSGSSSRVFRAA